MAVERAGVVGGERLQDEINEFTIQQAHDNQGHMTGIKRNENCIRGQQ